MGPVPKAIMALNYGTCCISSNPYCIPSSCTQRYGPSLTEQCLRPEQLIKDLWYALFTKFFSREDIPASSLDLSTLLDPLSVVLCYTLLFVET